jgi:bifunctional non-homologous end joining protein LigD
MYEAAARRGLEGIIAKRADSPYVAGRSADWLKLKCERRDDFVIGGYALARDNRKDLGALLLGQYAGERLLYAGRVGTGFTDDARARLMDALAALTMPRSPFADGPAGSGVRGLRAREARYIRPELVCEVRFSEWTAQGQLRHPRFLGLRSDKRPRQWERSAPEPPSPSPVAQQSLPNRAPGAVGRGAASAAAVRGASACAAPPIAFTNLEKVFWPDDGYTKGDLVGYYRTIAPLLLPYLRDRPVVLTRYPDGIAGQHFYQQDAPEWVPDWVYRVRLYSKEGGREINYFVCNDLATLLYIANLGAIPLHVWASRVEHPERPDWMVLDLDPGEAPFTSVVAVACGLHTLLRGAGLRTFVKTSGSAGLHLLVPLAARYRHAEVKQFAELVARVGAESMPELATVERRPARRETRVYIDYVQNGHGKTVVAPYAVRALRGAPVSAPLRWSQVGPRLAIADWTIRTLPARIRRSRDDPLRRVLGAGCDLEAALRRLERRLA